MRKQNGVFNKKIIAIISTASLLAALTQPAAVLANEGTEVTGTAEETVTSNETTVSNDIAISNETAIQGTVPEPVDGTADTSVESSAGETVSSDIPAAGQGTVAGEANDTSVPTDTQETAGTEGEKALREVLDVPAQSSPQHREVIEPSAGDTSVLPENVTTQVYETTPVIQQTGNGQIIGREELPEDVFSVALPMLPEGFYNFTMDPQGLRQIMQEEGGEDMGGFFDGSSLYFDHHTVNGSYSGTSDIVDIVNRSNIPVLLTVTLSLENRVASPVAFTSMSAVDEGEPAPRVAFGIVPAASARLSDEGETPDFLYREQMIETDENGYATATFYLPGNAADYEEGIRTSAGFAITGACSRNDSWGDFIRAANESGENLKIHITYAVDRVTDTHSMAIERGILNIDPATGMLVP